MPEQPTAGADDEPRELDRVVLERLEAEVTDLRLQIGEGVRTRQLVVVDDAGVARARIAAESGGDCRFVLLDDDGFERIQFTSKPNIGTVTLVGRSNGNEPTCVEMFALDPDDDDGAYVGVELVDNGNSVAGVVLYEGRPAHIWTEASLVQGMRGREAAQP